MKVIINFSKRWLYTLITIGILAIIAVGVYAIAGVSHTLDEINLPSCGEGQVLGMGGGSWICVDVSSGGITQEIDPTVKTWAKTDNPSISGTLSANVLKVSGGIVSGGSTCSSSQWGEIRRCRSSAYDLACICIQRYGSWNWDYMGS